MRAEKSNRQLKKLTKSHPVLSILFTFLGYLLFILMMAFASAGIVYYVLDSKLTAEYDAISYFADLYENGYSVEELLDRDDRSYIIRDADGNDIYNKGEMTISDEEMLVDLSSLGDEIHVYLDTKKRTLFFGPFKLLYFNPVALRNEVVENKEIDEIQDLEDGREAETLEMIDMPIWIAVDMKDGGKFIGQGHLRANLKDFTMVLIFSGVIMVFTLIMFCGMVIRVIKNLARQRKIINFFFTDEVTGGRNWMWFLYNVDRFLKKRKNAGKAFAVLHLSIVKYRNYCLCHSISEGEQLLRNIDLRLCYSLGKNNMRRLDKRTLKENGKREFCAHASSSTFALLLEFNDHDTMRFRIDSIMNELKQVDNDHNFEYQIGVDVIWPSVRNGRIVKRKNPMLEQHYNNACTAKSKLEISDNSGVMFFDDKLLEEQKWETIVEESQQRALLNNEFLVYYQPKYSPGDEKLKGAEALIRWNHPQYGLISPGRFIPIFEKNGFITNIDHYMISHVAADQKAWLDAGYKCVPVSVNVSRAHFTESDLAEQIRDIVDAAGTPHEYIEIELTESAFFDDKQALINTLEKLKEYGFSVSMDDFGSGYSSLNSLKDMSLDVLKLDADFFRGDADEERKEIVVSEAIRLARALNMRTVAEGVEDKDQVEFLASQGCDMIQGFIFAKPMPAADYMDRMRKAAQKEEASVKLIEEKKDEKEAEEKQEEPHEENAEQDITEEKNESVEEVSEAADAGVIDDAAADATGEGGSEGD